MTIDWRARIGTYGVWASTDGIAVTEAVAFAQRLEGMGYGTLWLPETMGRDPFTHIAHLAGSATKLVFATGIANIHHRHPGAMLQATNALAEQTDGRFVLGLGVSHAPMVAGLRKLTYDRPLATMRAYLEGMDSSPYMSPAPAEPAPRLLAALGPKMLELAASHADGAHPYWTTPEHTATARSILGPDKLLCVEQKIVLSDDPQVARETAIGALAVYIGLPNYRNNWLRLGFTEDEISSHDPRFLDAVVAWGSEDSIRDRLQQHLDAGADHVCIQALTPGQPFRPDETALQAFAPPAG